jgi:hypothetical protein
MRGSNWPSLRQSSTSPGEAVAAGDMSAVACS